MELPLTINPNGIPLPDTTEALIREKAARLGRFYDRIVGCRVTLEGPGGHHRNGSPYKVRIEISVPGPDLVVNHQAGENLPVAIREAFEAAQRRLQDHVRLLREDRRYAESA
ncbi:MAG TPA: HPF/RaiA family ribosome-associated protein [Thermoanaerobaculia bacterium]|nr:HPF/RaiA family ribosome-associated protein [Thermoanaerobaculia bacterium]